MSLKPIILLSFIILAGCSMHKQSNDQVQLSKSNYQEDCPSFFWFLMRLKGDSIFRINHINRKFAGKNIENEIDNDFWYISSDSNCSTLTDISGKTNIYKYHNLEFTEYRISYNGTWYLEDYSILPKTIFFKDSLIEFLSFLTKFINDRTFEKERTCKPLIRSSIGYNRERLIDTFVCDSFFSKNNPSEFYLIKKDFEEVKKVLSSKIIYFGYLSIGEGFGTQFRFIKKNNRWFLDSIADNTD